MNQVSSIGPARLANQSIVEIQCLDGYIEKVLPCTPTSNGESPPMAFPGILDMHVHFRQPGAEQKEDLVSGSRAALYGGVTSCGDMPNNNPPTNSLHLIHQKISLAKKAPGRLTFHIAATLDFKEIESCFRQGLIKAVKLYLGESTGINGFSPSRVADVFRLCADLDLLLMLHAEDDATIQAEKLRWPLTIENHGRIRSIEAERRATIQALEFTSKFGNKTYFCHVSNQICYEQIHSLRRDGAKVFIEVTPHHLYLDESLLAGRGVVGQIHQPSGVKQKPANFYQVNPPLRDRSQVDFLRSKLTFDPAGNHIDTIGSDHAPHLIFEKQSQYPSSPSGIPGTEFMLPLMANLCHQGYMSLARLEQLLCQKPAEVFDFGDQGRIAPGCRADIVLWDELRSNTVDVSRVKSKCGWSPYEGLTLTGWPQSVYLAGEPIIYG